MKFSLIIGTMNRKNELVYCLKSLLNQSYKNYEIIIIDQSSNDETSKYVKSLNSDKIIYEKVNFKGLSKARNRALKLMTGDYFCLIDDDAFYDENYLANALYHLDSSTIVSGYIYDTNKRDKFANYNHSLNTKVLNIKLILNTCPSAALIIPFSIIENVGDFDEKLGVGAEFGAAEETDLLLRCVEKGYKVIYLESCKLKHPFPEIKTNFNDSNKISMYYSGIGALFKKHLFLRNNVSLIFPYLCLRIKLILKAVLFYKYDRVSVNNCKKNLKKGLNDYEI